MFNLLKRTLNNQRGLGQIVTLLIVVAAIATIAGAINAVTTPAIQDVNLRAITNITEMSGGGF